MTTREPVAVLGAGSWGTALAILIARNGSRALLWGRDPEAMARMGHERCNARYLPDITLPERVEPTADLDRAMAQARDLLIVVPSAGFRALLRALAPRLDEETRLAWATKGLESQTGRLLHEVLVEELGPGRAHAVISGPSFAGEVARGMPTAVTIASRYPDLAAGLAERLHGDSFRTYTSDDVVGVELGGALKNVLAIATGISDGLGFGANARAALITRGLAELMRFGEAAGARRDTLMGLSGLGDLVLTCTDDQSRNRRLGLALGRGRSLSEAVAEIGQVVEGAETARVVTQAAQKLHVEMPISAEVDKVLYAGQTPRAAVADLLARDPKPEHI